MKATPRHGRLRSLGGSSGFTLVELIVSTGITLVLALLLVGVTGDILATWNRTRGNLTTSNQAKLALDQLAADLESAVFRADGAVWLASTVQPDQSGTGDTGYSTTAWKATWDATGGGVMKPGNGVGPASSLDLTGGAESLDAEVRPLEKFRFGMAGVWLRFFTTEPDRNDELEKTSTIRAVGYQIVRYTRATGTPSPRYGLFRSWVRPYGSSPDSTFDVGYELFVFPDGSVSRYNSGDARPGYPGTIRRPGVEMLLANNVIDFGVRFWVRDASGNLVVRFPEDENNLGFAARTPAPEVGDLNAVPPEPDPGAPVFSQMTYGVPEVAEVFLRVLTDQGAEEIEALETGRRIGDWWKIAEAHSTIYTRWIQLKGRGL